MRRVSRPALVRTLARQRAYHDDATFGYRVPAKYTLPDYTERELQNRNENAALLRYVEMVRRHGHRAARVDPLDLMERDPVGALDAARYGLADDARAYPLHGIMHLPAEPGARADVGEGAEASRTLAQIKAHLMETYVDRIGYEVIHCPVKDERLWFSHQLETHAASYDTTPERQRRIHGLLARSEELDRFLGKKFPNLKRYGCEGAESMLPALDTLFELSAQAGIGSVVVALPHRGRLSLLTEPSLLALPPRALFAKIKGAPEFDPAAAPGATGDVISHLGGVRRVAYGAHAVEVEVLQNPSHLEAANPVALGYTRARQMGLLKSSPASCQLGDKVLCVQLHGDAAFAGQGVVAETLGLSGLPHYGSGGTVHVIVNNNIGYTTPASFARSSVYSSDVAKMIGCPILHVNGDYPEAVARAVDVAFRYRQMFRKDVVIDLICYRRWGHNELDEPAYTQPRMYGKIRARESVPKLYEDRLKAADVLEEAAASQVRAEHARHLDAELGEAETYRPSAEAAAAKWQGLVWPAAAGADSQPDTGVDEGRLRAVAKASVALPDGFNLHPRLARHVAARLKSLDAKVDFATAEALAFGTLMQDGYDVRISGQDVGRGTFSQRHAMLVDQETEDCVVPLNDMGAGGKLELANSSLSEFAVLGFEVGMSWASPRLLPIWEAQFGDFANGAQVVIDTFVVGAQAKWLQQSALTLLLPHGYDGAGPEHSSARIERFLQLSDDRPPGGAAPEAHGVDANLIVANPSTPAQMYHLLRRQMLRNYRKPLVVASPKGLLRSPAAASPLAAMAHGTAFVPVLHDARPGARTVVLCSGKHYYALAERAAADKPVALVRLEELSPFPYAALEAVLREYPGAELVWAQEEPANMGAWAYVRPRLEHAARAAGLAGEVRYAGREAAATVATGVRAWHRAEAARLLEL